MNKKGEDSSPTEGFGLIIKIVVVIVIVVTLSIITNQIIQRMIK